MKINGMRKANNIIWAILILLTVSCSPSKKTMLVSEQSPDEILKVINKINDYWQTKNPVHGLSFWDNAAYQTGNMEAYAVTGNDSYKKYAEAWAEYNHWMGATSPNKSAWKLKRAHC